MSEAANETGGAGPSHRGGEAGVAIAAGLLGLITVLGSLRVGIGWGDEGPMAGFFPFYIGLIIIIASVVNFATLFVGESEQGVFATWDQLGKVVSVVIPTAVYVALLPYIGIYVASGLLIAGFMRWFGNYSWMKAVAVGVAVPVMAFVMFERWFLVPLPKGPIEKMLGF